MKNIAIFLAEGFEEIEALTVVDLCRRAGVNIVAASVGENPAVKGSHGISVNADCLLGDVDFDSMDMLVLPGGMPGTKNLEACGKLMEQVDRFFGEGKYVAAICAAPSILGHRGILRGLKACCYPGFESHLEGAEVTGDRATVCGHVITGRGMGCAIDFGLAIVTVLCGKEKAEDLARSIVYRD